MEGNSESACTRSATLTMRGAEWRTAITPAMPASARIMASISPSLAPVPLNQAGMRARLQGTWARPKSCTTRERSHGASLSTPNHTSRRLNSFRSFRRSVTNCVVYIATAPKRSAYVGRLKRRFRSSAVLRAAARLCFLTSMDVRSEFTSLVTVAGWSGWQCA